MLRHRAAWLSFIVCAFDLGAVASVWLLAYAVRFNGEVPHEFWQSAQQNLIWILPLHGLVFRIFGLYRGIWVFASLPDLLRLGKAVLTSALLMIIGTALFQPAPAIPRSVLIITPLFLLLLMGGSRALYRTAKELYRYGGLRAQGTPVLVLGAGASGANLVRELMRSSAWRLVGLLDDAPDKLRREVHGYKVWGPISELQRWSEALKVKHAIIAMPSAPLASRQRIATLCVRAGVRALVLPALTPLTEGQDVLSRIRNIDLEDLLRREPVTIDAHHVAMLLKQRVVMVTGAGGSIGAELCRQILHFSPAQLIAFEISEYAMYRLTEELSHTFPGLPVIPIVGDVKDALLVDHVMQRYAPHIVFHAAAYKHVPLMEAFNAWQAVRNNALGTCRVARAAIRHRVARFVLISTDKAVNPVSVMGASKRLAEMVCQTLQKNSAHTQFETVRFGNVLGSTGSVTQKFQEQIAQGGPVTVTHPEVTRFFMTISEAVQLVLQASSMGQGGEIFILDMGHPVRIADLARDLIRLSGCSEEQIKIVYTGLRPGEKLYEELLARDETTRPTHHAKLRIARARRSPDDLIDALMPWLLQRHAPSDDEVRRDLRRWVVEYAPFTAPALATLSARERA